MSELVAAVLGGLVVLLLGPMIERRVRAAERWEQDVLRFGDVFNELRPSVRSAAHQAWRSWDVIWAWVEENGNDPTDPRVLEQEREARTNARLPYDELNDLQRGEAPMAGSARVVKSASGHPVLDRVDALLDCDGGYPLRLDSRSTIDDQQAMGRRGGPSQARERSDRGAGGSDRSSEEADPHEGSQSAITDQTMVEGAAQEER